MHRRLRVFASGTQPWTSLRDEQRAIGLVVLFSTVETLLAFSNLKLVVLLLLSKSPVW